MKKTGKTVAFTTLLALANLQAYEWRNTFPETKVVRYLSAASDENRVVLGGPDGGFWTTTDFETFTDLSFRTNLDVIKITRFNGSWGAILAKNNFFSGENVAELDGVVAFSNDGFHWDISVPPGFDSGASIRAIEGGPTGWVLGSGLNPRGDFSSDPFGFLTTNGKVWESFPFAAGVTSGFSRASHIDYEEGTWLAFAGNVLYRSSDGRNWDLVNDTPSFAGASDSAFTNGTWVVLTAFQLQVSNDLGETWQSASTGISTTGIAAVGDSFVATGTGGEIAISTNGINWAPVRTGGRFHDNGLSDVVEFQGKAYAVGEGGLILKSDVNDLLDWTVKAGRSSKHSFEVGSFETGLTHDGESFIAVSGVENDLALFSSPDGESWTLQVENTSDLVRSATVSGGGVTLFAGARLNPESGRYEDRMFRYENGLYEALADPDIEGSNLEMAGYANGHFFLNTFDNQQGNSEVIVSISTDGRSWSPTLRIPLSSIGNINRDAVSVVHTGSEYYIAFFSDFDSSNVRLYRSGDLTTWEEVSNNLPTGRGTLTYGNGRFVATTFSNGTFYSDNGRLFFSVTGPPDGNGIDGATHIATNGNRFFAFTEGRMWVSEDGINWDGLAEDQDITFARGSLVAAEGKLVVLGDEPQTGTSLESIFVTEDTAIPRPEFNFLGRVATNRGSTQAVLIEMMNNPVGEISVDLREGDETRATLSFNDSFGGLTFFASASIDTNQQPERTLILSSADGQVGPQGSFRIDQTPGVARTDFSSFRLSRFSEVEIANGLAEIDADPELDGVSNGLEFLFDLDPANRDSSSLPALRLAPHPDDPECLQVRFFAPRFIANSDLRFSIDYSTDLVTFTPLFAEDFVLAPVPGESELATLTFNSLPLVTGEVPYFFRLRAANSNESEFGGSSTFTGFDDFDGSSVDLEKWQVVFPQGPLSAGVSFSQANGQLQLSGNTPGGQENFGSLLWNRPLPLDESWQVEVSYRSGDISLGSDDQFAGAGIFLVSELNEEGLQAIFEYVRDPSGQLELQVGDEQSRIEGVTANGTKRLTWDHQTRSLTASYRTSDSSVFRTAASVSDPFAEGLTEVNLLLGISGQNANFIDPLALDQFSVTTRRDP
jgi:hypothetical protein